jgi:hypothetical protein
MQLILRVNKHTFINKAGRSVVDYIGLISSLVGFSIGSEITSSRVGNMLQRNMNTESIVEKITHNLVKYECYERAKSELLDVMNSNISQCSMYKVKDKAIPLTGSGGP